VRAGWPGSVCPGALPGRTRARLSERRLPSPAGLLRLPGVLPMLRSVLRPSSLRLPPDLPRPTRRRTLRRPPDLPTLRLAGLRLPTLRLAGLWLPTLRLTERRLLRARLARLTPAWLWLPGMSRTGVPRTLLT
jgi:hypothetical protein